MTVYSVDMPTHADIASHLVSQMPPGTFAYAARAAVVHQDFITLERMLPGVKFAATKVGPDEWQLAGACDDGSTVIWRVGD